MIERFNNSYMDLINKNIKEIKNISKELVKKDVWPMKKSYISVLTRKTILLLQEHIAKLCKQRKFERAKEIINKYAFSFVIRMYAIHQFTGRKSRFTPGIDGTVILNDQSCLNLLEDTKFVKVNKIKISNIRRVKVPKKSGKYRDLGIGNIIDRVLQKSMILLIEPYYEALYHTEVYGFRPGRSTIQAVGLVYKYISTGQSKKILLKIDIKGCFDNKKTEALKNIWVPTKYRKITDIWLTSRIVDSKDQVIDYTNSGVSQGSIIRPLFTNVLLNGLKDFVYQGFPKFFKRTSMNSGYQVSNHCITYADDIILIFNCGNLSYIKNKIEIYLSNLGLKLSEEKTKIFTFEGNDVFKFDYLGFTIYLIPIQKIKKGILIQKDKSLYTKRAGIEPFKVFIYPSNENMKKHKDTLKETIRASYNLSPPQLIEKLNPIIRGFSNYYNYSQSYRILSWLDLFVHKRLLQWAKKKFKKLPMSIITKKYFVTKQNLWGFFGKYSNLKSNDLKRLRNIRQLESHIKLKTIPIYMGIIPVKLRNKSFYTNREDYVEYRSKVWIKRGKENIYSKESLLSK